MIDENHAIVTDIILFLPFMITVEYTGADPLTPI